MAVRVTYVSQKNLYNNRKTPMVVRVTYISQKNLYNNRKNPIAVRNRKKQITGWRRTVIMERENCTPP